MKTSSLCCTTQLHRTGTLPPAPRKCPATAAALPALPLSLSSQRQPRKAPLHCIPHFGCRACYASLCKELGGQFPLVSAEVRDWSPPRVHARDTNQHLDDDVANYTTLSSGYRVFLGKPDSTKQNEIKKLGPTSQFLKFRRSNITAIIHLSCSKIMQSLYFQTVENKRRNEHARQDRNTCRGQRGSQKHIKTTNNTIDNST